MIANLSRLHDKPIYITENGLSTLDDRFRIVYLVTYLNAIHEAIRQGADVRGYLYWSLLDNYEWSSFKPRFGLCHVDFETFERTVKPSGYFYREIIRQNAVSPDLVKRYLSELPTLGHQNPAPTPPFITPGFVE
jgi:beta-glucosidase